MFIVYDGENDQAWGPYDSEAEATADIILMANEGGWTEVIEAGDFPFDDPTGLRCVKLQPKTGRAAY
jgi:hypothetical protein